MNNFLSTNLSIIIPCLSVFSVIFILILIFLLSNRASRHWFLLKNIYWLYYWLAQILFLKLFTIVTNSYYQNVLLGIFLINFMPSLILSWRQSQIRMTNSFRIFNHLKEIKKKEILNSVDTRSAWGKYGKVYDKIEKSRAKWEKITNNIFIVLVYLILFFGTQFYLFFYNIKSRVAINNQFLYNFLSIDLIYITLFFVLLYLIELVFDFFYKRIEDLAK